MLVYITDNFIDFIFSHLQAMHITILAMIIIKIIHYNNRFHKFWSAGELLHFDQNAIRYSRSGSSAKAKVIQNRLTNIIAMLIMADIFLILFKVLVNPID